MTGWSSVFLAIIALGTATMAILQVGAVIYASRMARRMEQLVTRVEGDLQPLIGRANDVADDAARVASLAAAQVERVDALLTDVTSQVETSVKQLRTAVISPTREGLALVSGLRAAIAALRGLELRRRRAVAEEDDALFIG